MKIALVTSLNEILMWALLNGHMFYTLVALIGLYDTYNYHVVLDT